MVIFTSTNYCMLMAILSALDSKAKKMPCLNLAKAVHAKTKED